MDLKAFKPTSSLFPSAAALSFYSILNLIPLMYIGFFIIAHTPSFAAFSQKIKLFLLGLLFPGADNKLAMIFEGFLKGAASLDMFGFGALLFALFSTFSAFEKIICEVTSTPKRSLAHALAIYWALTTLAPLALGASFYISYKISNTLGINILVVLPFFIIWALFMASFYFCINASLKKRVLLLASFIAAVIWSLFKAAFLWYLTASAALSSIYGGFSALFAFFLLLYFSWIIYLYAALLLTRFSISKEPSDVASKAIKRSKFVRAKR